MKSRKGEKLIIFEAVPFCYGPASIALAIVKEIRQKTTDYPLKIIAFGQHTSYELFSSSKLFDECYHIEYFSPDGCPETIKNRLIQATTIICIADFDFSKILNRLGLKAVFVDPLYWMWDEDPIRIDSCYRYFTLNFPGVAEKISWHSINVPDDEVPIIVNAIRDNFTLANVATCDEKNSLLVNYGGMQSPLGHNFDLVLSMSRCILDIVSSESLFDKIFICGGGEPIRFLARELQDMNNKVVVKNFPQTEFFDKLAECRVFITVPGLSVVYEALYLSKVTFFILPLNYSQHLQSAIYKKVFKNAYFISWNDLHGYAALPAGLPEEDGVDLSIQQGEKFSLDGSAQSKFKEMLSDFLHMNLPRRLTLNVEESTTEVLKFDGATQIAQKILSDING